jgi:uncharacterized protein
MRTIGPLALAAVLVVAGCSSGGGEGTDTSAGGTTTAARPTPAPEPTAPVTTVATSAAPSSGPATTGGRAPEGFDAVTVRLPGSLPELCLWLAATAAERQQGLMAVTSLGGADGMLFDMGGPTTGEFWMYQTLLPLSIAFYDADGAFVSSADMEPCATTSAADCPRYGAAAPYAYAVEVAQGDLGRLGLVAGSRIEVGGACAPA